MFLKVVDCEIDRKRDMMRKMEDERVVNDIDIDAQV